MKCLAFWGFLALTIALGGAGGAAAYNAEEGTIFTDAGDYEWIVSGALTTKQRDMVITAYDAKRGYTARRRLADDEEKKPLARGQARLKRLQQLRSGGRVPGKPTRRGLQDEESSGEEDITGEREETAAGRCVNVSPEPVRCGSPQLTATAC